MNKQAVSPRLLPRLTCLALFALTGFIFLEYFPPILRQAHATVPITSSGLNTQVSTQISLPSGKVQYNITDGTRVGTNLFHSFGDFNIPTNNIANFLNTLLNGSFPLTSNILGRVTGGNISNIFGTIQTTGFGNANLFLMNPAGFLFGPNATVNMGGLVAFTTADYLRLTDNVRFNAVPNGATDVLLSTGPVAAYGFLGSNPGAITVQGSQFTVADGTGISMVGGNIMFHSGTPDGGSTQPARLSAPNGSIQLASATSPGEFLATSLQPTPNVNGQSFTSFGSVSLAPGSTVEVSQTGSGTVSIRGGQFVVDIQNAVLTTAQNQASTVRQDTVVLSTGSSIVSATSGTDRGADIEIVVGNLQMDGASIKSTTTGAGGGGDITIRSQTVNLTNGGQIVSSTSDGGDGGNITVSAGDSLSISGYDPTGTLTGVNTGFFFDPNSFLALVTSGTFTTASGTGNGGHISINSQTVVLDNAGTLATITSGKGRGGDISLDVGTLNLRTAAQLLSSSGEDLSTFVIGGSGQGGDIAVTAADSIRLSSFNLDLFSASTINSQALNGGGGGNISLSAPNISLQDGAVISSVNIGAGTGGSIMISAENQLSLSGTDPFGNPDQITTASQYSANGGAVNIVGGSMVLTDHALIQTLATNSGNAGDITLQMSKNVNVTGGSSIGSVGGGGSSGNITVSADTISLSGFTDNSSRSRIENTGGSLTGNIILSARNILLTDGARINMEASTAQPGNISISATDSLAISNHAKIRMHSSPSGGGMLDITAHTLTMDQSILQTITDGAGDAPAINLHADNLTLSGGLINSETQQVTGRGGAVIVDVTDKLSITGRFTGDSVAGDPASPAGIFTRTVGTSGGDAGPITVSAGTIELSSGAQINTSTLTSGQGGMMNITTGNLVSLSGAGTGLFSEASGKGGGGVIAVQANQVQLSDGAVVSAKSTGSGAAGNVTVGDPQSPTQFVLIDGSGSGIFTDTQGTGAGGNIILSTQSFTVQNGGTLSAATSGGGVGGTITAHAGQVTLNNGTVITASTTGEGAGGSIGIITDSTFVSNASAVRTIASQAAGGNIDIIAGKSITMTNGSSISASSVGAGNAGNIIVNAGQTFVATNSAVTTQADAASGGNITVQATNMVQLTNSQLNASVQGSSTTVGGNITIDPQYVILQNSQILAQATQGQGGAISIIIANGGLFLSDANSTVSASSQFGVNGTVTIQSPNAPISGQIQPLGKAPLIATSLVNQHCTSLAGGEFSSFTVGGRDSLPTEPGNWLASPLAFGQAGFSAGALAEGDTPVRVIGPAQDTTVLSLRQIAPPGFLTQAFAVDWSASCRS